MMEALHPSARRSEVTKAVASLTRGTRPIWHWTSRSYTRAGNDSRALFEVTGAMTAIATDHPKSVSRVRLLKTRSTAVTLGRLARHLDRHVGSRL